MRTQLVLTLTGPDRVGIVEDATAALLKLGANVETSRMARLGGEFAMLLLVTLPAKKTDALEAAFSGLANEGYRMVCSHSQPQAGPERMGWQPYTIEVQGADHEGIIHEIAQGLSQAGINIESLTTGTARAPMSGAPLFTMSAEVVVPPGLSETQWLSDLITAGEKTGVEITVAPAG